MPVLDINDVASIGVVKDIPPQQVPPEAWTTALNVIPHDDGIVAGKGWEQIFGTPGGEPHFAIPLTDASQTFWLYVSKIAGFIYDGASHTDITRMGGAYTTSETRDLNGTIFGGIPIINNNADAPQFWPGGVVSTKLEDLSNWPASTTAKKLTALGAYLVAINVTKSGSNYPHLVKWSSEATDPGALPGSWDETDLTIDAGEYDLPDVNSGILEDSLALSSKLFLYKDQSTWSMRFIGGRAVFAFDTFSETLGILAPRCVTLTGDGKKHVLATQDDIVIHDGSADPVSIVDKRLRRSIFNNLDPTNYLNSFMFTDTENNLVVFCYPQNGSEFPDMCLYFNYKSGAVTEGDGIDFLNAAPGRVETSDTKTWATVVGSWDTNNTPWSLTERRKLVLCKPTSTKLMKWNTGFLKDGLNYSSTLQRTSLALVGRKRTGEWIVNEQVYKMIDRILPKLTGQGIMFMRLGSQDNPNGVISWTQYVQVPISAQLFADLITSGRFVAIEFFTPAASDWRLDGYRISLTADGEF